METKDKDIMAEEPILLKIKEALEAENLLVLLNYQMMRRRLLKVFIY